MSTRESFTATIDGRRFRITLAPDGPDADRVLTQALGVGYCQQLSDALERQEGEDLIAAAKRVCRRAVEADAKLTAMTEHRDVLAELLERERNALARLRAKHGQACSRLAAVRRAMAGQRGRDAYEKALVRAMALRCGLEDPDTFEMAQRDDMDRYGLIGPHRGTGRTTRMLLEALVALEAGFTVEIVVVDVDQARELRERMARIAEAADLDTHRHATVGWTWAGGRAGSGHFGEGRDVRLVDHAAQEASDG